MNINMPEAKLGLTRRSYRTEGEDRVIIEAVYRKNSLGTEEEKVAYLKDRLKGMQTDMDLRETSKALQFYEYMYVREFVERL